mmetsp:Transcript_21082/g.41355  ORF Transcript_21082/g.41355 Transcript_21082/m.41355 type:complete len:400 (+) Transcript_21082:421-1620(+)
MAEARVVAAMRMAKTSRDQELQWRSGTQITNIAAGKLDTARMPREARAASHTVDDDDARDFERRKNGQLLLLENSRMKAHAAKVGALERGPEAASPMDLLVENSARLSSEDHCEGKGEAWSRRVAHHVLPRKVGLRRTRALSHQSVTSTSTVSTAASSEFSGEFSPARDDRDLGGLQERIESRSREEQSEAQSALEVASNTKDKRKSVLEDEAALISVLGQSLDAMAAIASMTPVKTSCKDAKAMNWSLGWGSKLVPEHETVASCFVGKKVPSITVVAYLRRLVGYVNEWQPKLVGETSVGVRSLIMSMIYVDRLCSRHPTFAITQANVHRVCMTAFLISIKFLEDVPFPNSFWCRVAGVCLHELNILEEKMIRLLDWDLAVSQEQFDHTLQLLGMQSC